MDSKLELLFQLVLLGSKQLREANARADGLAFWQPIKKLLAKYDTTTKLDNWNQRGISKETVQNIMKLPEKTIDGYGEETMMEENHFLIQTVRLPIESPKPNLRKIIQVALNIGQYIGISDEFYSWMSIDKYVTKPNIEQLSMHIPANLIKAIFKIIVQQVPSMECLEESIRETCLEESIQEVCLI
jgi:Zn-dependent M32 family carboxypeptidase